MVTKGLSGFLHADGEEHCHGSPAAPGVAFPVPAGVLFAVAWVFLLLVPLRGHAQVPEAQTDGRMAQLAVGTTELNLTEAEKAWLAAHPRIRFTGDPDWLPMEAFNAAGEYVGIVADYLRLIEQRLGLTFDIVPTATWTESLDLARSRQVDILSAMPNEARRAFLNFTKSYMDLPVVITVRRESPDITRPDQLDGKRAVVPRGYAYVKELEARFPRVEFTYVETVSEGALKVSSGQADALMATLATTSHVASNLGLSNLKIGGPASVSMELALGVRTDWPELHAVLSKALSTVSEEEQLAIHRRWVPAMTSSVDTGSSPRRLLRLLALAVGILLAFTAAVWLLVRTVGDRLPVGLQTTGNRAVGIVVMSLFLTVTIVAAWAGLRDFELRTRKDIGQSLQALAETTQKLLGAWLSDEMDYVEQCVHDPRLVALVSEQLAVPATPADLARSDPLQGLRRYFDMQRHWAVHTGFAIISPELVTIASSWDAMLGVPHCIATQRPQELQTALSGRTVFVTPMAADAPPHPDDAAEVQSVPAMFTLAPVKDRGGKAIAVLAVRLDPARDFTRLCQVSRVGGSGETYAFDDHGRISSQSRFTQDLVAAGMLLPGQSSILSVRIADPGGNVVENHRSSLPADQQPLTRMAMSAVRGESGIDVDGYRDYRGVRVLGAWVWDRTLKMGLAAEIDESEAMGTFQAGRQIIVSILAITVILALLLTGYTLWSGSRANRALSEARDGWERVAAERTQELRKLSRATEESPASVVITDTDGRIEYVNPKFTRVTGYALEEALGQNPRILKAGQLPPEFYQELWQTITAGSEWQGEFCNRKKNGDIYWEHASISPIKGEDGAITHFVAVKEDVTERKKIEAALLEAKAAAEAATRAKSDFLANMSHEIRTPMNAVLGMLHLALRTELSPKQHDYLRKAQAAAAALLGIINDILDFSKIEAGKLQLETIDFSLDEVLDSVAGLIAGKAHDKGIELLFDRGPAVSCRLRGDPLRLGQILTNLASNAVKFTEKGEIVIAVEVESQTHDRVMLQFSVRDTGIGMSQEQADRLFRPFSQADASTTRKYGGTGLGLSICSRLAELMDGTIRVESVPGKGSTFTFTAAFGRSSEKNAGSPSIHPDLRGKRVLVIDDSATSREIFRSMLESMTFEVVLASDGEAGLSLLTEASGDRPIDLVLVDWKMPGCDGFEVSRRIKEDSSLSPSPKIIMVTAYGREEVLQRAERSELEGFLVKPTTESTLFDTIMQAFGKDRGPGGGGPRDARVAPGSGDVTLHGTLLLVEDNAMNQQVATEMLEDLGCRVVVANNGQEAVDAVASAAYDAVLMDIQMPVMDGYEATRRIRETLDTRHSLPIIAMTAHAMAGDAEKSLAAGMDEHITKPIDPVELHRVLAQWVKGTEVGQRHVPQPPQPIGPALPDRLPGLDLRPALSRVRGRSDRLRGLLLKFADNQADVTTEIREAWMAGDYSTAGRLAHTLKGLAGTIGADVLQKAARAVEMAAMENPPPVGLDALMKPLDEHMREVLSSISTLTQQGDMAAETSPPRDAPPRAAPSDLRPLLAELGAALDDGDPSAMEQLHALRRMNLQEPFQVGLERIKAYISQYAFEEALEALSELQASLDAQAEDPANG